MCCVRFSLILLVLCVGGYNCSFNFNDTTLASLPPLFGLDAWAQCREEGDVYCIVDAALKASQPSQILDMLQEFSKQNLKHYNRTQVHRGVCVSRCGAEEAGPHPWHSAAAACLTPELAKYGLEVEILKVRLCSRPEPREPSASARAFAVMAVVMGALVVLATGLDVLGDKCAKVDGNKYLLAFSLKRNWQILTYNRSKPRSDQRMKNLTSMEGLRVMSVLGVITTHVILLGVTAYSANPEYFEKLYDTFGGQMTMNSPLWLQGWFSMSAFLTTYMILIISDKSPITLWGCLLSVINRYIRLTPAAGVVLWYVMTWYPRMGTGPQWLLAAVREAHDCSRRWWGHMIYGQNYMPMGALCMPQTWYLGADMQLHVFGIITLYVLLKWRKATFPVLSVVTVGSALSASLVAYFYHIKPLSTGQSPESLRQLFLNSNLVRMLYLPMWMNLVGYTCGMATAFIYHYTQVEGIKLNQKKWFNILFHAALPLGSCVVALGAGFLRDSASPRWLELVYTALDRLLVAVCFNIFLLGCFTRCKSAVRNMLEWRGFHYMGRLSYSVFLVHFCVLVMTTAATTQLIHVSLSFLLTRIISTVVLSYVVAIPFCLVFELPPIQLWKALTQGDRADSGDRPRPEDVTSQPAEPIKPLDLVANIRRRQEV